MSDLIKNEENESEPAPNYYVNMCGDQWDWCRKTEKGILQQYDLHPLMEPFHRYEDAVAETWKDYREYQCLLARINKF